jgi:hypothetical protein
MNGKPLTLSAAGEPKPPVILTGGQKCMTDLFADCFGWMN